MGVLKTIANISALLGAELFGRALIGAGVFGILLGSIVSYIIIGLVLDFFRFEKGILSIVSTISLLIVFFLSAASLVLGILMLIWARKKQL